MYEEFFGMDHTPFVRDIPSGNLYESSYVEEILGRLSYAADRQLFAVLTSDAGCGKSTIIRKFTESLYIPTLKSHLHDKIDPLSRLN